MQTQNKFGILTVHETYAVKNSDGKISLRDAGKSYVTGEVNDDWLTDEKGKKHKINGSSVIDFKLFKSKASYEHSKYNLKNQKGFGVLKTETFTFFRKNSELVDIRFSRKNVFVGEVSNGWLTKKNGKKHKINGKRVVYFKLYKDRRSYEIAKLSKYIKRNS